MKLKVNEPEKLHGSIGENAVFSVLRRDDWQCRGHCHTQRIILEHKETGELYLWYAYRSNNTSVVRDWYEKKATRVRERIVEVSQWVEY